MPDWTPGTPILDRLRAWDGASPLAFDPEDASPGGVRWGPGAMDGVATHHMGVSDEGAVDEAERVLNRLRAADEGGDAERRALYEFLRQTRALPLADTLLERLLDRGDLGRSKVAPVARWLVAAAAHPEPLKTGITLLGASGSGDDLAELQVLARHDEFTLFSAVAVSNLVDDPVGIWWEMARRVHGWGKVHLVERLCEKAEEREELRGWLLRHGCANSVMDEYLAGCCARAGGLAEALCGEPVDEDLLDGGCRIIEALLRGGPAESMDHYEDGVVAARALVGHLEERATTLARIHTARALEDWLDMRDVPGADAETWDRRAEAGWTTEVRRGLSDRCAAILKQPGLSARVETAYTAGGPQERWLAWQLAPALGIDLWDRAFARLDRDPLNHSLWFDLSRTRDAERFGRLLNAAEKLLPLDAVATGPANSLGLGPDFRAHACLDILLGEMPRMGIVNARLLAAALRSPVVRNRNLAVSVLARLEGRPIHDSLRAAVERATREETDEEVGKRISDVAKKLGLKHGDAK